jgi:hypothetical protein
MTNLTKEELNQLKKEYCFRVTDNMDLDTLIDIVQDSLMDLYSDFDQEEMKEEIINYYCEDEQEYNNMMNDISKKN